VQCARFNGHCQRPFRTWVIGDSQTAWAAEARSLGARFFRCQLRKEHGESPIVLQAPGFLWVVMAASALHPRAEKNPRSRLGEVFDLLVDKEVADRSVRMQVVLRRQQLASPHVERLVVSQRQSQSTASLERAVTRTCVATRFSQRG